MKQSIAKLFLSLALCLIFAHTTFSQPQIQIDPENYDFGRVPIRFEAAQRFLISNEGDERLIFTANEIENIVFGTDFRVPREQEDVHFQYEISDRNHSVLIDEATWDGAPLAFWCQIAALDPRGTCAGLVTIAEEGERFGLAIWGGDEDEEIPGYLEDEDFLFVFYDPVTESEVQAEFEVNDGNEQWTSNGFTVISITAEGGDHRGPGEMFVEAGADYELNVLFTPFNDEDYDDILLINTNVENQQDIEVEITGTGYDNLPPEWIDVVEQAEVMEMDEIELIFIAEDRNDDMLTLGLIPIDLPDGWTFEDHGDGTCTFIWEPEEGLVGSDFHPLFTASDGFEIDSAEVILTVTEFIAPPYVEDIPDQIMTEDQAREDLFDLDDYFIDPAGNGFDYQIIQNPEQIQLRIDGQNVISAQPEADFWTEDVEVSVRATSRNQQSLDGFFMVNVNPVNDSPLPFILLAPENDYILEYTPDENRELEFQWEASQQNEYEEDAVHYMFSISQNEENYYRIETDDTTFILTENSWLDSLQIVWEDNSLEIKWTVEAVDDSGSAISAVNGPFGLRIRYEGINQWEQSLLPQQTELHSVYPNPFNDRTSVRYGVPISSTVSLRLYNLSGQVVRDLSPAGMVSAGWHQTVIEGADLVSGIYILRMENLSNDISRRVVYVR